MTADGEKKIPKKAVELVEAIKEELEAEKNEAINFVHDLQDAAQEAVEETKEMLQEVAETVQKSIYDKAVNLAHRKDEVVLQTAETLKKAIDTAKCALVKEGCSTDASAKPETVTPGIVKSDTIAPV
jgi:esterase/lipase